MVDPINGVTEETGNTVIDDTPGFLVESITVGILFRIPLFLLYHINLLIARASTVGTWERVSRLIVYSETAKEAAVAGYSVKPLNKKTLIRVSLVRYDQNIRYVHV